MGDGFATIDRALHDAILVDTNGGQEIKCVLITWIDTIENQTADDLLPGRSSLVPEFRLLQIHNVPNVLHDTVQRPCRQNFVFVVIGDGNQKLGVSVVHSRSQIVAVAQSKLVGIASGGGICIALAPVAFQILRLMDSQRR